MGVIDSFTIGLATKQRLNHAIAHSASFGLSGQGKLGRMILFGNFFGHCAFSLHRFHGYFVMPYGSNGKKRRKWGAWAAQSVTQRHSSVTQRQSSLTQYQA